MPENEGTFDLQHRTQLNGFLLKRPYGHQSNKWTKRFFLLKDGYLLYYAETEKRDIEKRKFFNIHPKGVIPLGGCKIEEFQDPVQPFCIVIKNDDFNGTILLAADSAFERDKWISTLKQGARVTWENARLTDSMMQTLESQGIQMAQEKQFYLEKFTNQSAALQDEREKTEELERIRVELEKEKLKMEEFAQELKAEHDRLKEDLEHTQRTMTSVEDEKQQLLSKADNLETHLQELATEKHKVESNLHERESLTRQLSQEIEEKGEMVQKLKAIEQETERLMAEKAEAEAKLKDNESFANMLIEEKEQIKVHASELEVSMKELIEQKTITEQELKEEVIARLDTEKRLERAENSLANLEGKLNQSGTNYTEDEKGEMMTDVKSLKAFFENLAQDAKQDSKTPMLMQTTVSARKTFVARAKSRRYKEKRRKIQSLMIEGSIFELQEEWHSEENLDQPSSSENSSRSVPIRRTVSMMAESRPLNFVDRSKGKENPYPEIPEFRESTL